MSVRASSSGALTRWPLLLRLTLDVVGGPVIALLNQQAIYAGNMWACGHDTRWSLHIAAVLCLAGAAIVALDAWLLWRSLSDAADTRDDETARTRFILLVAMMVAALSIAVILAQWLAVFMFAACMRA